LSTVTISAAKLEIEVKRIIPAVASVNRFRFIVCVSFMVIPAHCKENV
jgi:hypothetical protein